MCIKFAGSDGCSSSAIPLAVTSASVTTIETGSSGRTSGRRTTRFLHGETWTYDDASNVLTHVNGGVTTTFGYDAANQLTSESRTGYSASYSYDANGNRLTKTLGGVTENYSYDDGDKLQDIKIGGVT